MANNKFHMRSHVTLSGYQYMELTDFKKILETFRRQSKLINRDLFTDQCANGDDLEISHQCRLRIINGAVFIHSLTHISKLVSLFKPIFTSSSEPPLFFCVFSKTRFSRPFVLLECRSLRIFCEKFFRE
jgi:hypothetical protein